MLKMNRVWSMFSRKTIDGDILKFRIEEVSKNRIADVVELCTNFFAKEEAFHKAAGVPKSEEAIRESREVLSKLLNMQPHHIVVCCLDDESEAVEFIGASLMVLVTKEDKSEEIKPQTPEMDKFFHMIGRLFSMYDALEDKQLDRFYDDRGVVVHPSYRRLGIAREFLKVRRMICKEHKVPMTGAWMTSAGSQKAAEGDGWETVYEINYEELGRQFGVTFDDVPLKCKYMIADDK